MTTTSATRKSSLFFFFFNDTATTEIYTLSLHDALPILFNALSAVAGPRWPWASSVDTNRFQPARSEEHTSELQSQSNLVCRLLLEKKKRSRYLGNGRAGAHPARPPRTQLGHRCSIRHSL